MKDTDQNKIKDFFENDISLDDSFYAEYIEVSNVDLSKTTSSIRKLLKNKHFKNELRLNNIDFGELRDVEFRECTFEKNVHFEKLNAKEITFTNCIFHYPIELTKSTFERIDFINCEIVYLSIINCTAEFNKLKQKSNDFNRAGIFLNSNEIKIKVIIDDLKSNRLVIRTNNFNIEEIAILNCENLINIDINAQTIIKECNIGDVNNCRLIGDYQSINLYSETCKNLEIGNRDENEKSKINCLTYSNRTFEGLLKIQNSEIRQLEFADLNCNSGSVRFNNLNITFTVLNDVSISNLILNSVHFTHSLEFLRCDFSGLKPNNVTWLKDRKLSPDYISKKYDKNDLIEMRYQRDMYRQLKIAYENNKDKIESLAFYRNEMRLYWKEIKNDEKSNENGKIIRFINKIFQQSFIEEALKYFQTLKGKVYSLFSTINYRENKFLIRVNYVVSNFGQSYLRPLIILLFSQLIFCVLIWWLQYSNQNLLSSDVIWSGISQYLLWINPVFKAPEYWSAKIIVISTFMRMFNSFLIYHFIKATRKFS